MQDDVIKVNLSNSREEEGKRGFCAPKGLMHTNPNSEVTEIFSTVPERFEMKSIADGRK